MALQVWLPLNDSIQNKGLSNATVTVNGTTAYANGKRGRCLSCNGSSYWLISPLTIGTTASISFWAKTTDTNAMFYVLGATSYAHLNFWRANSKYYLNKGDSYQNPFQNNGADVAWHNDGNWHHYVTVFDGSMCSLYVDGAYYGSAKTYAAPTCNGTNVRLAGGFSNGHSYDTNGLISDFRVYDNVLTNEDIKELYWGKILEFTPQWIDKDRIMDASGFNFPLTPHNLTISGNEAKFNGSSTYVEFNGLHLSGGSVSIWANLPAKPNAQKIYYCDPTSKMVVGYLAGGTILTAANGVNKASYQSTGITWKQWHHIVAVWNSSYVPTALYVNGVQAATGTSSNWTNSGGIAAIGRRVGSGNADYLSGSVNEVKVFSSQLTAAEAQELYAMGPCKNNWAMDEEWMLVLHHNAPATNLFTQGNARNCDEENLFSRLRIFDNNDSFRRSNGTYEFMVKEKLEATSAEQTFRWTQTSNPTATTCTGYALVSQTMNPNRNFGISFGPTGYCLYSNKASWWCATGCWTAYQGGIPGYGGIVKTGYMDLYVRVDKEKLPEGYTRLSYIQSNGSQYIDTGVKACMNRIRCVCDMSPLNTNDTAFFGSRGTYYLFYRVGGNYFWPASKCETIQGTLETGKTYHVDWNRGIFEVTGTDGVYQKGVRSNNTQDTSNMYIFNFNPTDSRSTTAKLYNFYIYIDDVPVRRLLPAKRNSDNVIGLYDMITGDFLTNAGTGTFIAGPEL